jgi:GNAT superfamily N-acetyltransferase
MGKILFQLIPEIIDLIIFGMENQSDEFCVNVKTGKVLSVTDARQMYGEIEDVVIPVPGWLPADGFYLMESFVVDLHNPVFQESLRNILTSGKGAFRNFKKAVKENKTLTQQWYLHKDRIMKSRVIDWYNRNSDILKYQDINENTDETDNLIITDFVFTSNSKKWESLITGKGLEAVQESMGLGDDLLVDYFITRNRMIKTLPNIQSVFISAETVGGDFAGCISGFSMEQKLSRRFIYVIDRIWVEKIFRGLGIARLLLDKHLQDAAKSGAERIIYELPGSAPVMVSSLEAMGAGRLFTTLAVIVENV